MEMFKMFLTTLGLLLIITFVVLITIFAVDEIVKLIQSKREPKISPELVKQKDKLFDTLRELVWNHAKFADRNGRCDADYITHDVANHWTKYHTIIRRYSDTKRK